MYLRFNEYSEILNNWIGFGSESIVTNCSS